MLTKPGKIKLSRAFFVPEFLTELSDFDGV